MWYVCFVIVSMIFSFTSIIIGAICLFKLECVLQDIDTLRSRQKLVLKKDTGIRDKGYRRYSDVRDSDYIKPIVRLTLIDAASGEKFEYTIEDSIIIGRGTNCDLDTGDRYVSSRHCRFVLVNGQLFIEDMHSKNGTYLNGYFIYASKHVYDGDTLVLGSTKYFLHIRPVRDYAEDF